ncbi:MAG: TRAM domain-containing protein, partial [Burkholderiales bacterium]
NALADHVPDEVKEERRARFMQRQERISALRLKEKVGRTLRVLVDEAQQTTAIGRSTADAPEIDGLVHIRKVANVSPGDWVQVHITDSDAHDLHGEAVAG